MVSKLKNTICSNKSFQKADLDNLYLESLS